ncbi:oligosaccharide flippase family protein [Wenzhouxiangella sp. XN24]|uniref:oligosaccharide flippase family protein n=1 Tax=Wenzhouxiangella sp. XN24 TaxID=2713569 RepID=UPI0013EAEFAF|nr:oligosaccharide flippase family protein [Wenzhouxiangella sp. XN24]NGX17017.1 oligosaccharide flippase family protein [Wenzhouxiangella sp. XN24]
MKAVVALFLSRALFAVSSAATTLLIARTLGADQNGIYASIVLIANMIAVLASFGLPVAATYTLAKGGSDDTNFLLLCYQFFGYFISAILVLGAVKLLNEDFALTTLALAGGLGFARTMNALFQGMALGKDQFIYASKVLGFVACSSLVSVFLYGYYWTPTVSGFSLISIFYAVVPSLLFLRLFHLEPKIPWVHRPLLSYGLKSYANNVIAFLVYRIDLLVIGYFLGTKALGIYSIAISIIEMLMLLTSSAMTVYFNWAAAGKSKKSSLTALVALALTQGVALCILLYSWFSESLVAFLGAEYAQLSEVLPVLALSLVVANITKVLATHYSAIGRPSLNTIASLAMLSSSIIVSVSLVPEYGLVGAAYASVFAYLVNLTVKAIQYRRLGKWESSN